MFHPMRDHYYIAIDWETVRINAYLCYLPPSGGLEIIDEVTKSGEQICMPKALDDFAPIFLDITQSWRNEYGCLPVFMGGQIGAKTGWKNTPLVSCPVAPLDIICAQIEFEYEKQTLHILPGLSCRHANGHRDVMRGEAVKVLGWLQASAAHRNGNYLICLPGVHTKWVLVSDGVIKGFRTAITGEIYDLLKCNSTLIQSASDEFHLDTFKTGASCTLESTNSIVQELFSVSSMQLFNEIKPEQASSYLLGLLIGSDVRTAWQTPEWNIQQIDEAIIIGGSINENFGESRLSDLFERVIRKQTQSVRCFHGKQASLLGFSAVRHRYLAQC